VETHDSNNALCWSFHYVNDNKLVDVKFFQLMRRIFCYVNPILILNVKTQVKKGLLHCIIVQMELLH
jgi:hypothetical protein